MQKICASQQNVGSTWLFFSIALYMVLPRLNPVTLLSNILLLGSNCCISDSAMGVVTLLSGQPKEGIPIEARAESKGYFEETTTDSSGFYRLRGLLPETTYVIKVAKRSDLSSAGIERASPESITVIVSLMLLPIAMQRPTICIVISKLQK